MTSSDSFTKLNEQCSSCTFVCDEGEANGLDEPGIIAVFNGEELNIKEELIKEALSAISVKHYNGNCLPPEEPFSNFSLLGEDYIAFDYEEEEEKNLSKKMSSMIHLCYQSKREASPENIKHDFVEKPSCLQEQINFRNSFWNLHRPELCKLTWPYVYVGEATVTEHLHRHIRKHGEICSNFHDRRDMVAMLDTELDLYNKLKIIQSPREIPPDEKMFFHPTEKNQKLRKMKLSPCHKLTVKQPALKQENDDDDYDDDLIKSQMLHSSNEEFCITIGRPIRRRSPIQHKRFDFDKLWSPHEEEFEKNQEYIFSGESRYSLSYYDARESVYNVEYQGAEETLSEEATTPSEPETTGWVEPDYCAMI